MNDKLPSQDLQNLAEMRDLANEIRGLMHKFNNHLFIISGKAQLLAETVEDVKLQTDLENIYTKIHLAAETLKEVYLQARPYFSDDLKPSPPDTEKTVAVEEDSKPFNRILVCDGAFQNLEILSDLLESENNLVWTAQNFQTLLAQFQAIRHNILIIDENLPDFDMTRFLQEMNNFPKSEYPTVIMMTNSAGLFPEFRSISKPISIEQLLSAIGSSSNEA